jgi:hypothetical protein
MLSQLHPASLTTSYPTRLICKNRIAKYISMLQYFIFVWCIIFFVVFAYIKIRFPFWNNQPVFHTYDYWRYFYTQPFILYNYPVKTKFCDTNRVKTLSYLECSHQNKIDMANLLQCYYISSERVCHTITKDDIHAHFIGNEEPAYISFYNEIRRNEKIDASYHINTEDHPIAMISSRPATLYFRPTLQENQYTETPVNVIDFLCVHRNFDKKKISRTILQTHEYNQRKMDPNISISIIKKEITLFEGVVPLVKYKNALFHLRPINVPILPEHFHVNSIRKESSMNTLVDFLHEKTHETNPDFDLVLIPSIGSLTTLIQSKLCYVFCLRNKEQIIGLYFFKDLKCKYEDIDGDTLQCVGSVMNVDSPALFFLGFLHGLRSILKENSSYKMLFIDEMSHNKVLLKYWREKHTPVFVNDNAYYLFNFIYPRSPLYPEKCLILF